MEKEGGKDEAFAWHDRAQTGGPTQLGRVALKRPGELNRRWNFWGHAAFLVFEKESVLSFFKSVNRKLIDRKTTAVDKKKSEGKNDQKRRHRLACLSVGVKEMYGRGGGMGAAGHGCLKSKRVGRNDLG